MRRKANHPCKELRLQLVHAMVHHALVTLFLKLLPRTIKMKLSICTAVTTIFVPHPVSRVFGKWHEAGFAGFGHT